MLVPGFVLIIVFSAVHRLFKNARANDTTGNVRACDCFSYR